VNFQEADRHYAELKRQHDEGTLSTEEFDAQLQQMMVRDYKGRWWAKSRQTGDWHYHDGTAWRRADPQHGEAPEMAGPSHPERTDPMRTGPHRVTAENLSATSSVASVPAEIRGWNWGAFLFSFIWAFGNRLWGWGTLGLVLTLLGFVIPFLGLVPAIILGIKGNEWAWHAGHWNSIQHFKDTQRKWVWAWLICVGVFTILIVLLIGLQAH
jgi:hypothetical protein